MSMFNASIYRKTSGNRYLTMLRNVVLPLAVLLFAATAGAATTVTYYHNDALGSPVAATNEAGDVIWQEQYRPFGVTLRNELAADTNSRSFSGHVKDKETGLLYMGARFYDPQLGRFMAIDPQEFKASNPQTFNRYAYANNNPYKYVDPDGEAALVGQRPGFLNYNWNPLNHVAIVLRPDNPSDFANNPLFKGTGGKEATLGGQAFGKGKGIFGNLRSAPNYEGDNPSKLNDLTEIKRPKGMTDTEFINK